MENDALVMDYEKLKQEKLLRDRTSKEKMELIEDDVLHKVEKAEKAAKEAENAKELIRQELERKEDLRAQIAETEDALEEFRLKEKSKSKSCPSSPTSNSFSNSNKKTSGSPQRSSKSTMRASIADTQYKLYEYEDLLGFIFAPPEVSPRLTPREAEIVSLIYNSTYNDFLNFKKQNKKTPKDKVKHSKTSNKYSNDDYIRHRVTPQSKNRVNDDITNNDQLDDYDRLENDNYLEDRGTFTEDNDMLTNYSYLDGGLQYDDDDDYDEFSLHEQFDTDVHISNDDTAGELLLYLPDSFHDIIRNYLPLRIFKTVLWLKQLPKHFRKQSIPIKRKTISVFRVASHEASLLKARIAFLERRKFASSSPKRFNSEVHRYEIQLLILGNEMRRFRFS